MSDRRAVLLLSGPTGSGKNTTAHHLVEQTERCCVVDYDVVRNMFVRPHLAPWQGAPARAQDELGAHQAAMLARNFHEAGYDVIVLDVLTDEMASLYRAALSPLPLLIVQLMPSWEVIQQRSDERAAHERRHRLTPEELQWVYEKQRSFQAFDHRLDTGAMSSEEAAGLVRNLWTATGHG